MDALLSIVNRFQTDASAYWDFINNPMRKGLTPSQQELLVETEPLMLCFYPDQSDQVIDRAVAKNGNCLLYARTGYINHEKLYKAFGVPGIALCEQIERDDGFGFSCGGIQIDIHGKPCHQNRLYHCLSDLSLCEIRGEKYYRNRRATECPEIVLEAVKQGMSLSINSIQTVDICLVAVRRDIDEALFINCPRMKEQVLDLVRNH